MFRNVNVKFCCNNLSVFKTLISPIKMSVLSSNGNSPSPPSSSVSYSLLSGSSEQDQPTSQTHNGDQPARLETQRELLKALRELKIRMPTEWHRKGRSSTLASLQYALTCVKQVRGKCQNRNLNCISLYQHTCANKRLFCVRL